MFGFLTFESRKKFVIFVYFVFAFFVNWCSQKDSVQHVFPYLTALKRYNCKFIFIFKYVS